MTTVRKIKLVKDNIEKYDTYKKLNSKLEIAKKNNDYETVIMLSYSKIEDRLLSFLHYMYIIDRYADKLLPTDNIDRIIRPLLKYKEDSSKGRIYKINSITTKIKILYLFCRQYNDEPYLEDCYNIINKNIGIDNYKEYLKKLKDWLKFRNEITHASYNKNIEDLEEKCRFCAIEGERLALLINDYTNAIKKNDTQNSIRDKYEALAV